MTEIRTAAGFPDDAVFMQVALAPDRAKTRGHGGIRRLLEKCLRSGSRTRLRRGRGGNRLGAKATRQPGWVHIREGGRPVKVLGINALFHDPAAALVIDGETVAAAEEERFSRRKHGKRP